MKLREYIISIVSIICNGLYTLLIFLPIFNDKALLCKCESEVCSDCIPTKFYFPKSIYDRFIVLNANYFLNVAVILFSLCALVSILTFIIKTKEINRLNFKLFICSSVFFIIILIIGSIQISTY